MSKNKRWIKILIGANGRGDMKFGELLDEGRILHVKISYAQQFGYSNNPRFRRDNNDDHFYMYTSAGTQKWFEYLSPLEELALSDTEECEIKS